MNGQNFLGLYAYCTYNALQEIKASNCKVGTIHFADFDILKFIGVLVKVKYDQVKKTYISYHKKICRCPLTL